MVTGIAGLKRKKSCTLLSEREIISNGLSYPRKGPHSDEGTNSMPKALQRKKIVCMFITKNRLGLFDTQEYVFEITL